MVEILQKKNKELEAEAADQNNLIEQLRQEANRSILEDLNKDIG